MLASHPDCMVRVEDEIFGIFGDVERPVTMEDLTDLKYLECCIKETMRICPSVTFISRECDEDVLIEVRHMLHFNLGPQIVCSLFQNHVIPAGTEIVLFIHGQHRNPADFPDPDRFDPDRFSPENAAKRSAYVQKIANIMAKN